MDCVHAPARQNAAFYIRSVALQTFLSSTAGCHASQVNGYHLWILRLLLHV